MSEPKSKRPEPAPDGSAEPDPGMRQAVMTVAVTALVLSVLSGLGFGVPAALGVVAGGALATVNLAFFTRLVAAFLAQKGNAAPWAILGMLKLLGLFAVAWIVLKSGMFSAIWFAAGYSALPIGITISTLLRKPPPDAAASPAKPRVDPSESPRSGPMDGESAGRGTPPAEDVLDAPRRD